MILTTSYVSALNREAADARWKDGRTNTLGLPTKQKLGSRSADASLARTHAAAHLEFGGAKGRSALKRSVRNILAPANNRVGLGQLLEFLPQTERTVQNLGEMAGAASFLKQRLTILGLTDCGVARYFAFYQGQINAADSCALACAEDICR